MIVPEIDIVHFYIKYTMKNLLLIILFLVFININEIFGNKEEFRPIVKTPLGQIEGYVGETVNHIPIYKFEGVPYAKPPVGELRFENPQDPEPWTGIWKANVRTRCMQHDHNSMDIQNNYIVHGDEDCLYVNIYTHSLSETANLDVLVHIHGGAFMFGMGATYGPDFLLERKMVLVTINYRLGPLGFLSTEDDVLPGNNGLRDQTQALKWIKNNIHYFGGNPNSITIHGLSAGGASVHFHYLLPASKGLFNQGISQSGCTLNSWVLMENVREKTEKIADLVGCPTSNSKEILDCLKSKPARHIVQAVRELQPWLYNPFSPFGAVVDGHWSKNPALPDHPYNLLKQGKVQDLPWIISFTSAEGLYPASDFYVEENLVAIDTKWNDIMPFILHYNDSVDPSLKDEVSQKIRDHYLENKPVNKENFRTLIDVISDRLFVADIEKAARLQSAAVTSPIFSYLYNYRGTMSFSDLAVESGEDIGVCHGDDTILLFTTLFKFPKSVLTSEADKKMSELLVDLTTSFMKKGSPSITDQWIPLSKNPSDPYRLLRINRFDDLQMLQVPSVGHREFWDSLPLKENANAHMPVKDEL